MAELHSVARRRRGASRAEAGDTAGEMAAAVSAAAEDEEEAKAKEGTCEWVVEASVALGGLVRRDLLELVEEPQLGRTLRAMEKIPRGTLLESEAPLLAQFEPRGVGRPLLALCERAAAQLDVDVELLLAAAEYRVAPPSTRLLIREGFCGREHRGPCTSIDAITTDTASSSASGQGKAEAGAEGDMDAALYAEGLRSAGCSDGHDTEQGEGYPALVAECLRVARWLRYGGLQTLASFGVAGVTDSSGAEALSNARDQLQTAMGADLIEWMHAMPTLWQSGNVAVVHAAASPARNMEEQRTAPLRWGHPHFTKAQRTDGIWVIHGHTIVDAAHIENGRIAIDTGAYATGRLTVALIEPGITTFQTITSFK